jgi:hypothetical protein
MTNRRKRHKKKRSITGEIGHRVENHSGSRKAEEIWRLESMELLHQGTQLAGLDGGLIQRA